MRLCPDESFKIQYAIHHVTVTKWKDGGSVSLDPRVKVTKSKDFLPLLQTKLNLDLSTGRQTFTF